MAARTDGGPSSRRLTICPFSGHETALARIPDPEFGDVALDELETMVRNEWRRRLGPGAYRRDHSRQIIRAALVLAVEPRSPIRETVVRQLLLWELATLGGWGLTRAAIQCEFAEFVPAIRSTLRIVGIQDGTARRMCEVIQREIAAVLDWPQLPRQAGEQYGHGAPAALRSGAKGR